MSRERKTMQKRHVGARRIITALLILTAVTVLLEIMRFPILLGPVIISVLFGYVVGRIDQSRIMRRSARLTLEAAKWRNPRPGVWIHPDFGPAVCTPQHCNSPTGCYAPRCYGAYYGGKWNPEDGFEPLEKTSPYPPEIKGE